MDLLNQKYADWTIIAPAEPKIYKTQKQPQWLCKCICGTTKTVAQTDLRSGKSKSCGCVNGIKNPKTNYKKEYIAWERMKSRCNNPNDVAYPNYGGRGITVCKEWNDFSNFLKDVGKAPSKSHVIDRIDCNLNYDKSNVRWINRSLSSYNTRKQKRNKTGYTGVYKQRSKFLAYISKDGRRIYLGSFATAEEAYAVRNQKEIELFGELINNDN